MCNTTLPYVNFIPVRVKAVTFEEAISKVINYYDFKFAGLNIFREIEGEINAINKIYNKELSVKFENNVINISGFPKGYKFNEHFERFVITEKKKRYEK